MTNRGAEIFDDLPDRCPGCGKFDTPMGTGPSSLMLLWQSILNSYICIDCNRAWTEWTGKNWEPEYRERNKPITITNIEKIALGKEPDYSHWSFENPRSMRGIHPPCPTDH